MIMIRLEELPKTRLPLAPCLLLDRLHGLYCTGHRAGLDYTDQSPAHTRSCLEEGGIRRDLLGPLRGANGILWVQVVDIEGLHCFI